MDGQFAITAFATAFTILDPVGMVPATLAVTSHATSEQRKKITNRAVLVAAAVIVFMATVGGWLLERLGITLPAFSIAGGILLLLIAIDMLFARPSRAKSDPGDTQAGELEGVAVFPLAIPMISGPGTIATVLLLLNLSGPSRERLAIVYLAYGCALAVTWLCMRGADHVMRILGKTGVGVMTRLLGIIMAALAVQFILNGLHQAGFGRV